MKDVNFEFNQNRFNLRVGAYITCKDRVLLQRHNSLDFYNLIGGRAKLNESSIEAIKREVKEEIGIDIDNPILIEVSENFFVWEGKNVHELEFVYKVELDEDIFNRFNHYKVEDSEHEYTYIFHKSELKNLKLLPTIIYGLQDIKDGIRHSIIK